MSKILILGGGFGGVRAALDLERKLAGQAEITLIDRNSYHLFVPDLYEVAAAFNAPKDRFSVALKKTIAIPYQEIFEGKKVTVVQADIASIDLEHQLVATHSEHSFSYDYLVLALGSQTADFGIPGVREYAFQFKAVDDALRIRDRIEAFFQSGTSQNPMKIIIGGAGFTGIELAAELAYYSRKLGHKHGIHGVASRIVLMEASDKILPTVNDYERSRVRQRLTGLGVIVMENAAIEEVHSDGVTVKTDGRKMTADCVVWTAGIEANALLRSVVGLELSGHGKIVIGEHLHLGNYKNVFAVGDNIEFVDHATQKPIPSLAYLAINHGKIVAKNIYNRINDREMVVHEPFYNQWVAPIGGKFALAHIGSRFIIGGFGGWLIREFIDIRYLASILSLKKALKLFWLELRIFTRND